MRHFCERISRLILKKQQSETSDSAGQRPDDDSLLWAAIGVCFVAFSVYAQLAAFIELSNFIGWLSEHWRSLIALPWKLISQLFEFDIAPTLAGSLTVLVATLMVVRSTQKETLKGMPIRYRVVAIGSACFVGFLYSAFIVVPALFDSRRSDLQSTSIAIESLSNLYYKTTDAMGEITLSVKLLWTAVLVLTFAVVFIWPYAQYVSRKRAVVVRFGIAFLLLFAVVVCDVFFAFMPIALNGPDFLGNALFLFSVFSVFLCPFAASVYLSDPWSIARRNTTITILLVAILLLDFAAYAIESIRGSIIEIDEVSSSVVKEE